MVRKKCTDHLVVNFALSFVDHLRFCCAQAFRESINSEESVLLNHFMFLLEPFLQLQILKLEEFLCHFIFFLKNVVKQKSIQSILFHLLGLQIFSEFLIFYFEYVQDPLSWIFISTKAFYLAFQLLLLHIHRICILIVLVSLWNESIRSVTLN